jgi:GNAT superfamily N-acetyltransferase
MHLKRAVLFMIKNQYRIVVSTHTERDYIDNQIVEFNRSKIPFLQDDTLLFTNYVIKNEQNEIMAGILSYVYCWKILYVDVLFVDEKYRHKGFGTQLLSKVEEEAKALGATLVHLDTFDFQAKDFYIKRGYEVFGVLDDCPPGHKRYYMRKVL